ncbi:MAG: elongation factor P [Geminicoccaceae bacterium]|nr:elongation factor P [Geminicoccaceae bacterium]
MKISVNDVKPGFVLSYKDRLWGVVKTEHVKPGKGPAYLQVEMKGLLDGTKLNERLRTADTIERVELDRAAHQFLYRDGDGFHFMNQDSFEQVALPKDLIGEGAVFLQEGMVVPVQSFEGRPVAVILPDTAVCTVVEADPVVKGQTAAASYKPALLDNGVRVMVPPHVGTGTRIVVYVPDLAYVERAKD